ncbi:isoprenylcysteine carboxylmethyltransferase family protein [Lentzea sp. NPDC034063]|uniref:methyltransferase family protein n=1 Tax=unclassified Lentzea TaxID=2643253 RepID=UPI0033F0A78F
MQIRRAALGSAVFLVIAPGTVAGLIPWLLTGWRTADAPTSWLPAQALGVVVLVVAVVVLLSAFTRFVVEGFGTPAPIAPPDRLVVGGLYRHVRNPMYVAVLGAIAGQALLFGQLVLLGYAALVAAAFVTMVRLHEEPALRRSFGDQYVAYRQAVPGWIPRLTPWRP